MKKVRILSLALALGATSFEAGCSRDSSQEEKGAQNETVDALYAVVSNVEKDLSQGYLLRSASDNERQMFTDVLYNIKIATMRLRKDAQDGTALSALYLASQEFDKLHILEQDGTQLDGLKNQLRLTLDQISGLQGKTLENVERVLFAKDFDYELAPFAALTAQSKTGWQKKNHNELHYAIAEGSKLNSWLFSPRLDLTGVLNPSFSVKQAINSRGTVYSNSVFFMVSANYEGGDPAKADWESLPVERLPDGNGYAVVETENVSLAKYAGKKIVLAFHYDSSTATTYPTWQINSFKLFGSGTFATSELNLAGATISGGAQAATVAGLCTTNPSAKKIFTYQFTKADLGTNFSKKETVQMISTAYEKYPNVVRFSGYGGADKPNKDGTSWLISKAIDLTNAKDVCLSFADESYFSDGNINLASTEVLVSSDYAGDTDKATWKTVEITGRKAATGVVKADAVSPKPVGIMLSDLGLGAASKVTVAFRYKSTAASAPWWAISDLTLTALQAGQAPLVITPEDAVSGTATTNKPTNGTSTSTGTTNTTAPAFVPGSPIVSDLCKNVKDAKDVFSYQFLNADLGSNFTVIDDAKNVGLPSADYYPGTIRFSGYNKAGNRVGTSWLVSKTLDLANAKDACLSIAEDAYVVKNAWDIDSIEILASTDFAGDVAKATWKKVDLQGRKTQAGVVNKTILLPKANGIMLKDVVGEDAKQVTIAFRYTSTATLAVWWGVADLTVRAVTSGDAGTPAESTTPAAEPAAPAETTTPAAEPSDGTPAESGSSGDSIILEPSPV